MQKISAPLDEEGYRQNATRLQEISTTIFGSLTDEVVLELLAERRSLAKENGLYESIRDEQVKRVAELTAEEQALEHELEELNVSITPDKDDDTLLKLIQQRKELEAKLETLGAEERELAAGSLHEEAGPEEESESDQYPSVIEVVTAAGKSTEVRTEAVPSSSEETPASSEESDRELKVPDAQESTPEEKPKKEKVLDAQIGNEKIEGIDDSEALDYLQFLRSNPEEALARLEALSEHLRKDKLFMLEVAKVDPAYAMHYADSKTLKRDEDFNARIAAMKNPRDSGNPLAEMLSDMRTNRVVMAAVKQDFRNLRYATRSMEGYAEMIEIAKREAREKAESLGQAVDVRVFLPKTLREDREFLREIEDIVGKLRQQASQESM
ncbi:MAG: hypothetical protein KBB51_02140 [Candidatus Moranbacteria bacterium]|jgi:hypothetical protein|nr:hypothetical protein [Candidatus Moranbacteria bacterium]